MTKDEAAWLSIRVTGVVVALFGLKQSPTILYLIWLFASGEFRDLKLDLSAQYAMSTSWPIALGGVIIMGVATYFLFAGKAIHSLLMKEK